MNKLDIRETNNFIQAFNSKERLHVRAFLIHGEGNFKQIEKLKVNRYPDIISHISNSEY